MLPLGPRLRHASTVNDRAVRYAVRGLVIATLASAIAAEIAARVVLSHGSGTYVGLMVFLPLLAAPGALLWRFPQPKYLTLWAIAGWLATLVWSIAGAPYRYERELPSWSFLGTPVWIAVALVLFAAPLLAAVANHHDEIPPERALLAQRLRRITVLAFALALIVAVTAFVLVGSEGMFVAVYTGAVIGPGFAAQWYPMRLTAVLWTVLCLPFALLGIWLWSTFGTIEHWAVNIVVAGLGTIYVLVLIALPIICIVTPERSITDSSARARYRSRNP